MDDVFTTGPSARWVSLLAVDPGLRTGWTWILLERRGGKLVYEDGSVAMRVALELSTPMCFSREVLMHDLDEMAAFLAEMGRRGHARAEAFTRARVERRCVVESFSVRESTTDPSLLSPVVVGAKLEHQAFVDPELFDEPFDWQSPSDAMHTITDERLKRWGLWLPGEPHACDSRRHALLWCRRHA